MSKASKKMGDMRTGYGEELAELGSMRKDVVVVGADTTQSLKTSLFGYKFPERFFNIGIAESNAVSIAAGLALAGKIAFVSTYAAFIPGKCVDQIRNAIAYPNLNVKIVASHAGLSVGPDGASHQQVEDIATMRVIPNMKVLAPADEYSTRRLVFVMAESSGPCYMRLARPKSPVVYEDDARFAIGSSNILRDGSDVAIIACGLMVAEALDAADILAEEGISCRVIDMYSIKPIDSDAIVKAARDTGAIVTAEEHNIIGGLGSAVAEVVCEHAPCIMKRVGVKDTFGESGEHEELLAKYGLKARDIASAAREAVRAKQRIDSR
ncbi:MULTISPECIES: transketolase family protein [Candidatus Nitrosocaldus]|jgi:transketolase|uniref:Transketolase, C-terminal subunit n=1 Tax=Candidatus Nitrosocaldus cavascurensis TaxID=2058097 RepID=A0A2K5APD6_9ARCH|nr:MULTISPECIES: transketolase family protein [Candidatus Nitrosocaldus]SPC33504.1 transketolase, C-terminal subunit [Candidatus Nitrosocaldus cavascurensis]